MSKTPIIPPQVQVTVTIPEPHIDNVIQGILDHAEFIQHDPRINELEGGLHDRVYNDTTRACVKDALGTAGLHEYYKRTVETIVHCFEIDATPEHGGLDELCEMNTQFITDYPQLNLDLLLTSLKTD